MKYKINYKRLGVVVVVLLGVIIIAVLQATSLLQGSNSAKDSDAEMLSTPPVAANLNGAPLRENKGIYAADEDGSLKYVYVTILPDEDPTDAYTTFEKTEAFTMINTGEKPKAQVFFQEGTAAGPKNLMTSVGGLKANAEIEVRGKSTTKTSAKSYKISLSNDAGLWQGQKVLNLNKHPYDHTRLRNKLSFDYFEMMPDMASLRTQFVSLYIKDLSKDPKADFVPYGLFTHIEQVNKRYLRMHGLDDTGNLYKASSFEFYRYEEVLKLKEDPSYDAAAFNQILEIKGSENHEMLIQMLEDLNDASMDINTVIEKHFNRENYLMWLASNIVFGNMDTVSQNFYLYRPSYSKTWYFLPWDYDGSWGGRDQNEASAALYSPWQNGVTNMWVSQINKRFLINEGNSEDLEAAIQKVRKIASKEQTEKMLASYYPVVSRMVSKSPDLINLETDMKGFSNQVNRILTMPDVNYQQYRASLEKPMPVYLWYSAQEGTRSVFQWESSYDLQNDAITYDFMISKKPDLSKPLYVQNNLNMTEAKVPLLGKGTYYWGVVIKDAKGNTMIPFDTYEALDGKKYFGVKEYKVE